jgi:glycosyltransferase involved in cell wall biosynthesis
LTERRALMIAYQFPPAGGVGVQRVLKFVTYLPRFGWTPSVVAPGNPAFPVRDESLMKALSPTLEIRRTHSLEPGKLPNAVENRLNRRAAGSGARATDTTSASMRSSRRSRILRKFAIGWNRVWAILLYPDPTVAWVPFACWSGWRAHRRKRVDVVFSSALPITTHMVGGIVAGLTRRPWIADFRDPWIGNPFVAPPGRLKRWLQPRTERWVIKRAARVTFAMDLLREQYAERYPDQALKFVYIPNGYDRADLIEMAPEPHEAGRFHILFAGSLYRPQELDAFLGGVEMLVKRRPEMRDRLRVHFVGRVNEANGRTGAEYSKPERLGDVISFEGFVPRDVALARMAGADALLQLMPDEPGTRMFVGGKLLEYLAMDRPILAVMPHGEGRQLVDSLPTGRSADVDPASVADVVERLVDDPPPRGPADPSGRYDRVNLTAELARLFDEVVAERANR